jgi:hypothetical protein
MDLYPRTPKRLGAVKALNVSKFASLELLILTWFGIEVVFKFS